MPELPEVETIARGLNNGLQGRRFASVRILWPGSVHADSGQDGVERMVKILPGSLVQRVYRRAKLLLFAMAGADQNQEFLLAFHLKMTGRVVHETRRDVQPHDRLRMYMDNGSVLTFADVRKFGYVRLLFPEELETWNFWRTLGPEPLESDPKLLAAAVAGRAARIKGLLLDQRVLAGCGNIYADESLFRAGVRPDTRACDIPPKRLEALFGHLQDVLRQAIAENGSSIRNYVNADGDAGAFQNNFNVYGRKGQRCKRCEEALITSTVAGRTSTFCPRCQE